MNFEQARFNMIEQQIRPWNVLDSQVLDLLSKVRREDFVPAAHQALAFADMELPLKKSGLPGQCMLSPKVEARMLQDAELKAHDKVLEIGTGSGYMAALLAGQCQRVVSLELDPELAQLARSNLQRAGVHNVEVRQIDGALGTAADAPFDVIVLSGSVADVPHALLEQLKIGGRLVAIIGDEPVMQACVIRRLGNEDFQTRKGWDTSAPRLLHFPEHSRFSF